MKIEFNYVKAWWEIFNGLLKRIGWKWILIILAMGFVSYVNYKNGNLEEAATGLIDLIVTSFLILLTASSMITIMIGEWHTNKKELIEYLDSFKKFVKITEFVKITDSDD